MILMSLIVKTVVISIHELPAFDTIALCLTGLGDSYAIKKYLLRSIPLRGLYSTAYLSCYSSVDNDLVIYYGRVLVDACIAFTESGL